MIGRPDAIRSSPGDPLVRPAGVGTDHGGVEREMRVLPYGDRALLVEVADLAAVAAVRSCAGAVAAARATRPGRRPRARCSSSSTARPPTSTSPPCAGSAPDAAPVGEAGRTLELPVVFDGEDLADVAELTGRSVGAVIAALTGVELTVAFGGFAPGFGYLSGLPDDLHVPRRATPRTRVPAGSVALAGPFAGAYPQASPGGWQLVGRTDAVLFDVDRDPPALLVPGTPVRFRDVG